MLPIVPLTRRECLMKPCIIAVVVALAIAAGSCKNALLGPEPTQPLPAARASALATLLDSLRYANDLPALACSIVTDTGSIESEAVGCRRYGGPENVTVTDQFHLGSNTKAMTAVLIGTFVDEGRLAWTTTLPEIFPELSASMRPEYRSVTVRDILSHSAGFVRDPSIELHTSTPREQRAEVVVWALSQPPAIARGHYLYSNLGYILAGAIAEKLANRPYEELLLERVMRPLGITTAGFGPMGTPGLEDQPLQHTVNHAPILPSTDSDNPAIYSPAGRLHLSIGDWALYIRWVLASESGQASLLKLETARMLTTGVVPAGGGSFYACGWGVSSQTWAGGRALTHAGCNGWNYSVACLAPGRHYGVIVATNITAENTPAAMEAIAFRLINYHLNGR
jgi:CubicO group peptidase (beta-lactamase class C family)